MVAPEQLHEQVESGAAIVSWTEHLLTNLDGLDIDQTDTVMDLTKFVPGTHDVVQAYEGGARQTWRASRENWSWCIAAGIATPFPESPGRVPALSIRMHLSWVGAHVIDVYNVCHAKPT